MSVSCGSFPNVCNFPSLVCFGKPSTSFSVRLTFGLLAYLTHRSGIDKTLMALIRAGTARRLCGNGWSSILRELHKRECDLRHLFYLDHIHAYQQGPVQPSRDVRFSPFSSFSDKGGYAGFVPSPRYISTVYVDFMIQIRPILDQVMSSLSGFILKWDHSFKVCLST